MKQNLFSKDIYFESEKYVIRYNQKKKKKYVIRVLSKKQDIKSINVSFISKTESQNSTYYIISFLSSQRKKARRTQKISSRT